jgi:hypothetical protein
VRAALVLVVALAACGREPVAVRVPDNRATRLEHAAGSVTLHGSLAACAEAARAALASLPDLGPIGDLDVWPLDCPDGSGCYLDQHVLLDRRVAKRLCAGDADAQNTLRHEVAHAWFHRGERGTAASIDESLATFVAGAIDDQESCPARAPMARREGPSDVLDYVCGPRAIARVAERIGADLMHEVLRDYVARGSYDRGSWKRLLQSIDRVAGPEHAAFARAAFAR